MDKCVKCDKEFVLISKDRKYNRKSTKTFALSSRFTYAELLDQKGITCNPDIAQFVCLECVKILNDLVRQRPRKVKIGQVSVKINSPHKTPLGTPSKKKPRQVFLPQTGKGDAIEKLVKRSDVRGLREMYECSKKAFTTVASDIVREEVKTLTKLNCFKPLKSIDELQKFSWNKMAKQAQNKALNA
jgi:hypothetical protein